MAIPLAGGKMREVIVTYREARCRAGHPGEDEMTPAFRMFCHEDGKRARELARLSFTNHLNSFIDCGCYWTEGLSSAGYPRYDKIIAGIKASTMESQIERGAAWIGSPDEIINAVRQIQSNVPFEHASLQVNFNLVPQPEALRSLHLFAQEVMPHFFAEVQAKALSA